MKYSDRKKKDAQTKEPLAGFALTIPARCFSRKISLSKGIISQAKMVCTDTFVLSLSTSIVGTDSWVLRVIASLEEKDYLD